MGGVTRRRLLAGAAGAGFAAAVPWDALAAVRPRHQAGIATAAQSRLYFAALDATAADRAELRDLMRSWSAAARRARAAASERRATSGGSRTGPTTSRPTTRAKWPAASGSVRVTAPRGCAAAATSSRVASGWDSTPGTPRLYTGRSA